MLAVAFVRSPYAHAKITNIDVQAALAKPGVACVLTGQDVLETIKPLRVEFDTQKVPFHKSCNWHVLTPDKVRFVGDMVAAVVATDRYTAEDAADLVEVDYEPLEAVADMESALLADAPLVHEEWGDNVMERLEAQVGEVGPGVSGGRLCGVRTFCNRSPHGFAHGNARLCRPVSALHQLRRGNGGAHRLVVHAGTPYPAGQSGHVAGPGGASYPGHFSGRRRGLWPQSAPFP